MKKYKKYEDIPQKYRFDLEDILGKEKIEDLIEKYFVLLEKEIKIKESKYESSKTYLKYLKEREELFVLGNKISNYLSNNISINIADQKFNKMQTDLYISLNEFNKRLGPEINLYFKNEKKLREWIELKEFANYQKDILHSLEEKKHKLSDAIEEFIIKVSKAEVNTEKIFSILSETELDYGYAISSTGKKTKITLQNRMMLLKNKDEEVRKSTFINWKKAYIKHKNTFSYVLYEHMKNISVWAKERKYKSTIDYLINSDKVDQKLLKILFKNVQENNYLFQKYFKLKKGFFEKTYKKAYKPWDSQVPLLKVKEEYTVEEMQDLVLKALYPLGNEYSSVVESMYKNRWIDYYPIQNKRSGAYSIGGSYGLNKKYILMNFDGTLRSVSTLAHEIGHSMHSYYSDNNQPYNLSQYPIFLAEIASIFNELMLQDYLINNSTSKKFKFKLLSEAIEDFEGTVRRQTIWANYEYDLYNLLDQNQSFSTFDQIKEIYNKNYQKYAIKKNNNLKTDLELIESVIIPHFYYEYYVYKYAIGFIVANAFFQKYKSGGKAELENYINKFLKMGNSDFPINTLKKANIDLNDSNIYTDAFKVLDQKVKLYEKLGKELIK
ncbi:MAG: oligoendopeptidase F [Metamycoplasmataceae bacterium]